MGEVLGRENWCMVVDVEYTHKNEAGGVLSREAVVAAGYSNTILFCVFSVKCHSR